MTGGHFRVDIKKNLPGAEYCKRETKVIRFFLSYFLDFFVCILGGEFKDLHFPGTNSYE